MSGKQGMMAQAQGAFKGKEDMGLDLCIGMPFASNSLTCFAPVNGGSLVKEKRKAERAKTKAATPEKNIERRTTWTSACITLHHSRCFVYRKSGLQSHL